VPELNENTELVVVIFKIMMNYLQMNALRKLVGIILSVHFYHQSFEIVNLPGSLQARLQFFH
jgi:hypothetical protein